MPRGRKPNLVPTVSWHLQVPIDLAFQVESKLMDPVTKRASYAARSKLLQGLLYEWLKSQGVTPLIPTDVMCPDCKRPKATSEADILSGACPRWIWPDSQEAIQDCVKAATSWNEERNRDAAAGAGGEDSVPYKA